jgi:DNA-binding NtrC family response regulator
MSARRLLAVDDSALLRRTRLAVVHDDSDLGELLRDAFSDKHDVHPIECPASMTPIAAHRPNIVIVGPLRADGDSLGSWELIALARAHRDLRHVPVIVLTPDLHGLMSAQAERFQRYSDVWVVGMPFDLETLTKVIATAERQMVADPHETSASVA